METYGKPSLSKCSECRRVKPDVLRVRNSNRAVCSECAAKVAVKAK
jgi:recombinational DNA repair protein (RecF pathway)